MAVEKMEVVEAMGAATGERKEVAMEVAEVMAAAVEVMAVAAEVMTAAMLAAMAATVGGDDNWAVA